MSIGLSAGRKILITGAAGFIGSSVADLLLDQGTEIVGIDNLDDFYHPKIKKDNLKRASEHRSFRLIEGDIRDAELVNKVFSEHKPTAVIHLAARAGVRPSLQQAPLYADVNVNGTTVLLEACRHHEVPNFVFASSSSVYGMRPVEPFSEEDRVDHPVSPYAATKKAGELLCYTYHHLFGLNTSCLRFFTVYGPRQRPEMAIHKFTRTIHRGEEITVYGDGSACRDFTYISDIVCGILASAERSGGYRVYNLGAGNTVVLGDVIEMIGKELGQEPKICYQPDEPGDVRNTSADVSLARRELGYEPRVPIAEGIKRFVEWYKERRGE